MLTSFQTCFQGRDSLIPTLRSRCLRQNKNATIIPIPSNLYECKNAGMELSTDTNVSAFWAHLSHHSPDVDRLRAATKSPEVRNQEAGTHSVSHRSSTNVYQSPHQFSAKLHRTPISFKPGREQNAERDQPSDVLNSATPGPLMGIEKKPEFHSKATGNLYVSQRPSTKCALVTKPSRCKTVPSQGHRKTTNSRARQREHTQLLSDLS